MTPDWLLLRRYAKEDSQEAFAALTARYLNLVYAVCLREAHDPELAQDATQAVFLLLARTAPSFRSKTALPGWLFRTARFAAQNARTREERRRRYEEKAAQAMMQQQEGTEDAAWSEIEPLLNQSLATLKPVERECVLLRFFQGLSFAEAGESLGLSEEATRKRVSRSLEKMQRFLTKEGVVIVGTGLAGLVLSRAAQSAPAPVASAVAQLTAGVVPGSVSLLSEGVLHAMKIAKMKTLAGAAALALVGTAATYGVVRGEAAMTKPTQVAGTTSTAGPVSTAQAELIKKMMADTVGPTKYLTVTLAGKVRLPNGTPARGVHVAAQIQNNSLMQLRNATLEQEQAIMGSLAHTRPDGAYTLYAGEGMAYNVIVVPEDIVRADDKDTQLVATAAVGISGAKGTTVHVPDLVLTPGGLISGTVSDPSGKPLVGVPLGCYGPQRPESGEVSLSTRTDSRGHYRFRVAPGQSRVYVAYDPTAYGRAKSQGTNIGYAVTVAEGATVNQSFYIAPARVQ